MKKISVLVPCYNEEENVEGIANAIIDELEKLKKYNYELVFIDNHSTDKTEELISKLCKSNKKIKAIFNVANFGQFNSPYYGMLQCTGDCVITICADFQDPVSLIPVFVKEWETNKYQAVIGIKNKSKESRIMYFLRTCYYKLIKKFSNTDQIEHFTGFGLYDKSFIEIMRSLNDPSPFLRGIVAEYAPNRKEIKYTQEKRKAGKTHNNFYTLYDGAMLSFTSYTKVGLRVATFMGIIIGILSFFVGLVYLVLKLLYWDRFPAGIIPILIVICFLGALQLFFIGFLGEYILSMNNRVTNRPLVVEKERINFED